MSNKKIFRIFILFTIVSVILLSQLTCAGMKPPQNPIFKTSIGGVSDAALNRMWDVYGRIVDDAVQRFGNEPPYFEMIGQKLMWSGLEDDKNTFRQKLIDHPCSKEGYLWSWATEEGWPTHHARHYENNAKYILGVYRYLCWTQDEKFLGEMDTTTNISDFPEQEDASKGMSLLAKIRLAMKFQLEEMEGKNGLAIITDPEVDGTIDSKPSDYWDNLRVGYKSAFINIYFYASLEAMAQIEESLGESKTAEKYREIAKQVKKNFNETFWNPKTQRFALCVDREGTMWDFGFTYLNTEAMFYGLPDKEKTKVIYDWMDGKRIVKSDIQTVKGKKTGSVGKDIYALKWAPRSNTRAIESIQVDGKYWWWDIGGAITVGGENPSAAWTEHLENGGAIFYTSYYDILARINYLGSDNAWRRLSTILKEFAKDELRRDPPNNRGAPWKWGITGEFPESGLVPVTFIYGIMGISADIENLNVKPNLPKQMSHAAVREVVYKSVKHSISARINAKGEITSVDILAEKEGTQRNLVIGNLIPNKKYKLSADKNTQWKIADENGEIIISRTKAKKIQLRS